MGRRRKGDGRGYRPRDYRELPLGSVPHCSAPVLPTIPWDDLPDAIERANAGEDLLSQAVRAGVHYSSQGSTNFCWMEAPVNAVRLLAVSGGHPCPPLSPAAGACRVTGFRNKGNNTWDSIPFIAEHGIALAPDWPPRKIPSRRERDRYDNEATWLRARDYRLSEWWELEPNNLQQLLSHLVYGLPVVVGLYHWMHMVLAVRPLVRRRSGRFEFGWGGINSHGPSGGSNRFTKPDGTIELWGDDAIAFDQACPATTVGR